MSLYLLMFIGIFSGSEAAGGSVGFVCVFILGILVGGKLAQKRYSKKLAQSHNVISASQVRELYRQIGRTPTEKQIKQMLSSVNSINTKDKDI